MGACVGGWGGLVCLLHPQPVKTSDADEKKSYVLAELYETEKNVVRVLNLICYSYFSAIRQHISSEDCRLLFDTAQVRQAAVAIHSNISSLSAGSVPCSP